MARLNSAELKARDLPERDLLALAYAFCNIARNERFGGRLASGEHIETDSYALAAAIDNLRAKNQELREGFAG